MLRISLCFLLVFGSQIAAHEAPEALICSLDNWFQPDTGEQGIANGEHKLILQIDDGEIADFSLPFRCDGVHSRTEVFDDRLEWGCIWGEEGKEAEIRSGKVDRYTKSYQYDALSGPHGPQRWKQYFGVCAATDRAF